MSLTAHIWMVNRFPNLTILNTDVTFVEELFISRVGVLIKIVSFHLQAAYGKILLSCPVYR